MSGLAMRENHAKCVKLTQKKLTKGSKKRDKRFGTGDAGLFGAVPEAT